MRTISILFITAVILALTSCGASKKVLPTGQQMPQYKLPGYYEPEFSSDPDEILRKELAKLAEENPCQYIALNWPYGEIRAYGEGEGSDEETARIVARLNAESELIATLNLWASDCITRTKTAVQQNGAASDKTFLQLEQFRFAESSIVGARNVLVKFEPCKNGVKCKMCVKLSTASATETLLTQVQELGLIEEPDTFRKYAEEAMEDIRLEKLSTL